jgi:rSAM/selenodomain-associated transferase 1
MSATLYIAAKAPRPGLAKTRLSRAIGAEAALALYRAFLHDLAARCAAAGLAPTWYVTPPDAWRDLTPLLPAAARGWPTLAQGPGDWTRRQRALFRYAARRGDGRAVLLASDSPQLDAGVIHEAFALLERRDLVLGPVHDGGYYLLGMRGWHDVLGGVTMSAGDVLGAILARAASLRLTTALLAPTYDIDEAADLRHLRADVARRADLTATARALRALDLAAPSSAVPVAAWAATD